MCDKEVISSHCIRPIYSPIPKKLNIKSLMSYVLTLLLHIIPVIIYPEVEKQLVDPLFGFFKGLEIGKYSLVHSHVF